MSVNWLSAKIRRFLNKSNREEVENGKSLSSHLASSARYKHWYSIFYKKLNLNEEDNEMKPPISMSIVKLCLDNLVNAIDVQDICQSNSQFVSCTDFEMVENCQFCQKESKLLDLCCPIKELQVGVFKKAITNSLSRHSSPHFAEEEAYSDQLEANWIGESLPKRRQTERNIILDISKGKATFSKLKKKLDNIRLFYPDIFYAKESIIELWTNDHMLSSMNFQCLDYDENSKYLWI